MATRRTTQTADPAPTDDPLIAAPTVQGLAANVTRMTLWRWRQVGIIPPPTVIRGRNYWRRSAIDAALRAMEQGAPEPQDADLSAMEQDAPEPQPTQPVRARAVTHAGEVAP